MCIGRSEDGWFLDIQFIVCQKSVIYKFLFKFLSKHLIIVYMQKSK